MERKLRRTQRILYIVAALLALLIPPQQALAATKTVKLEFLEESKRTSYEGSVPLAALVVRRLSEAGLRVVADEKLIDSIRGYVNTDALPFALGSYDALLAVHYQGQLHETEKYIRGMPVTQVTASVRWELRLQDREGRTIFDRTLTKSGLVSVFSDVLDSLYLHYLGDLVRSALDGHGERPVLLRALESESQAIREEATQALEELGEVRKE